jgi:formate dehydrogenase major subunit
MVQTDPNSQHVAKAIEALDLVIVQEIFMTRTAEMADVILPGASFLEKSGTFTNGERRVQRVNQAVEPLEGTKPDGQIVVELMNRMGYEQPDYDPATLLDEISGIVPFFAGIKWDELGINGKQWPVAPNGQDTPILHKESFTRGKGLFAFNAFKETEEVVSNSEKFPYILTTNRNLEHYNCGAQTRRTANVEIVTEDVIFIHPEDAAENGIEDTDMVCVESERGKIDIKAKVSDEIKKGVLSTTFHFPEVLVNNLTSSISDSIAMCPEYKVVSVKIRKARRVGTRV